MSFCSGSRAPTSAANKARSPRNVCSQRAEGAAPRPRVLRGESRRFSQRGNFLVEYLLQIVL